MDQNTIPTQQDHSQAAPQSVTGMPRIEGPVDLLKGAWKLVSAHWQVLAAIAVIPSVVNLAGILVSGSSSAFGSVTGTILAIIGSILSIAMMPAAVDAVHRLSTGSGQGMTVWGQYRVGFGWFWSVVLIMIIGIFVSIGSLVLFVIPVIIIAVYTALYSYVLVIEGKKGFAAFTESYALVHGRWWAVLGRILFLGVIMVIIQIILGLILGIAGISQSSGTTENLVTGLASVVVSAGIVPLAVVYIYRMYRSLASLRGAIEVPVKAFKKWLAALMAIGVVVSVLAAIIIPTAILGLIKQARMDLESARSEGQLDLGGFEEAMQKALQEAAVTSDTQ